MLKRETFLKDEVGIVGLHKGAQYNHHLRDERDQADDRHRQGNQEAFVSLVFYDLRRPKR